MMSPFSLCGFVVLLLLSLVAPCAGQALPEASLPGTVKLNELQYMGSHNSFHQFAPLEYRNTLRHLADRLSDKSASPVLPSPLGLNTSSNSWEYQHESVEYQFTDQKIRALEFDIAWDPQGGNFKQRNGLKIVGKTGTDLNGSVALDIPGLKILNQPGVDPWSQWTSFKDALGWLQTWSDFYTGEVGGRAHVPVIVTLELVEASPADPLMLGLQRVSSWNFSMVQRIEDEVKEVFPDWAARILSPDFMLSTQSTYGAIADVIKNLGWPTFEQAKSKILFHLKPSPLSGDVYARNDAGAVDYSGKDRLFFLDSQCTDGLCTCGCGAPGNRPCVTKNCATSIVDFESSSALSLGMVNAGFLVRAKADAQTNEARTGSFERRDLAISRGSHVVVTDFPYPIRPSTLAEMPWAAVTNYHVRLSPRCNPVTKAGDPCVGSAAQDTVNAPNPVPATVPEGAAGDFDFSIVSSFWQQFVYDNVTRLFLDEWAVQAGINTTQETISASVLAYQPPPYSPIVYAENIRDTPRIVGTNQWGADGSENQLHAVNVAMFGVPLFLLGALFLVCAPVCFCCPCCSSLNKTFNESTDSGKTLKVLLILWFVAVAGAVVAFVGLGNVRQAVVDGTDKAQIMADLPDDALVFASQLNVLVNQSRNATAVLTEQCPGVGSALQVVNQLPNASDIQDSLTMTLAQQVGDNINLADDWANSVFAIAVVFLISAILVLGILVFFAYRADKHQSSHPVVRAVVRCTVVPAGIASVSALCVLCGLLLALSAGISDLCADKDGGPDAAFRREMQSQGGAIEAYVVHRLACEGSNNIMNMLNTPAPDNQHLAVEASPLVLLASFQCNGTSIGQEGLLNELANNEQRLATAATLIYETKQLVTCQKFNELYVEALHVQACTNLLEGMLLLWVGLLLLTIPMMVILCKGGRSVLAVAEEESSEERQPRSGSLRKSDSKKDVKVNVEMDEKKRKRSEEMEKRKQEREKRAADRKKMGSRGVSFASLPSIDSRRNSATSTPGRVDPERTRSGSTTSMTSEGPKASTMTGTETDTGTHALLPSMDRASSAMSRTSDTSAGSTGSAGNPREQAAQERAEAMRLLSSGEWCLYARATGELHSVLAGSSSNLKASPGLPPMPSSSSAAALPPMPKASSSSGMPPMPRASSGVSTGSGDMPPMPRASSGSSELPPMPRASSGASSGSGGMPPMPRASSGSGMPPMPSATASSGSGGMPSMPRASSGSGMPPMPSATASPSSSGLPPMPKSPGALPPMPSFTKK